MKKHCLYCFHTMEDNQNDCPHCHKDNDTSNLTEEERHALHQLCHGRINRASSMKDSAMTFIVTGGILLIIGIIFLLLTYRYNTRHVRVWVLNSVQFVICIIGLSCGTGFLTYGFIRLGMALRRLNYYKEIIQATESEEKK